ncbi:hypothetical protein ACIQUF_00725 [Pseudomonas sp. NPDC090233]|uniref:hypothetical protein n=1 Tax=Pseudomonas sp. NPDC090233 TaxID=3364479 RepID=UPI00383A0D77
MKEIIRRMLIVLWLAAIATHIFNMFDRGIFHHEVWQISALLMVPIWALQFILLGIANPLALKRKG